MQHDNAKPNLKNSAVGITLRFVGVFQRSRNAFLILTRKRKAFYYNLFIRCCLSLFFISRALSHKDRPEILDKKLCLPDARVGFMKVFLPGAECPTVDMCCYSADGNDTRVSGNQKRCEGEDVTLVKEQAGADNLSLSETLLVKDTPKSDRLVRDVPLGFDEFKNKAINPRGKPALHQAGSIKYRVEPGGEEYNFASASKGAKLVAANKEAKGAPNILGKDMDKYLRNPCSAEEKFVVIELSEETLVDTIEIANFEHHSSNLKGFELLGSLVYPTDSWMLLGNFTAKNIKQSQRFPLKEHKWVRYLKLNFLSHYGSEFYCTLNTVQVYGVDAVEHMLEDLISAQDNFLSSEESADEPKAIPPQVSHSQIDGQYENLVKEGDTIPGPDDATPKLDASVNDVGDQVGDLRQHPVGRLPGDSVIKILMQKVRALDLNLSVLERYLEELNSRYRNIFTDFEKEIAAKDELLRKMNTDLMNLGDRNNAIEKQVQDIMSWKPIVSLQVDILNRENAFLRLKVERILENQEHVENKEIIVLLISLVCSIFATFKLFADMTSVFRRKQDLGIFCRTNIPWIFALLCFSSIGIILSL
ncbi:hypothetical protein Patl1_12421 [Pistacia atlantica]|uniref:Uncharacterized protein n=1 Tax=Pistacia atlantica TaxID=434234 RepID=A0ACC1A5U0_9ROSI|nr:hypothetical protein Patl1_12421 [Pistacia atlantica]